MGSKEKNDTQIGKKKVIHEIKYPDQCIEIYRFDYLLQLSLM